MQGLRLLPVGALLLVAGCMPEPDGFDSEGVTLERGMWRLSTTFGTPRLDGLTIDRLRDELPADKTETTCAQPVVHSGSRVIELMNLKRGVCNLKTAAIANGQISAEGTCPGIAAAVASETADSWIKVKGNYTPQYVDMDIDVVITATSPSGATQRLTVAGTHKAEKIGECS